MANWFFYTGGIIVIVYLDNTIGEALENNSVLENQLLFISSLSMAFYQGKLILFGNTKTIEKLVDKFEYPVNNIFQIIKSKNPEFGSVAYQMVKVFVITIDKDFCVLPSFMNDKSIIIPIETAMEIDWSSGCSLVCENNDDCSFYNTIGKYYCKSKGLYHIRPNFKFINGGGSTTGKTLKTCVCDNSCLSLCIIDTDQKYGYTKKYGEVKKGDTYQNVNKIAKKLRSSPKHMNLYEMYAAPVHEVENLIPLSFLYNICIKYKDACMKEGLNILFKIVSISNGEPLLYYDYKNGIDLMDNSGEYIEYWQSVLSQAGVNHNGKTLSSVVCGNILERFEADFMEIYDLDSSLDAYLISIWEEIGLIVMTWGCAYPPIRV